MPRGHADSMECQCNTSLQCIGDKHVTSHNERAARILPAASVPKWWLCQLIAILTSCKQLAR